MSQSRDKIISRVKKLLALANDNSSQSEAIEAALAAQRLIAQYEVEDFEINEAAEEISEVASSPYSGKAWRYILANIVADNFRCKAYTHNASQKSTPSRPLHRQIFLGYKTDATAALLVFEKLIEIAETKACEIAKEVKAKFGTSKGVKNTFLVGFCYGVKLELEKQSQALMLVTPGLVKSKFESLNLKTSNGLELDKQSIDCTKEGKEAGREAIMSSRLPCKENDLLLKC